MDELVRPAVADDADDLERLQQQARDALIDVRGGALRLQECDPIDRWAALIDDDAAVILVGTIDDVVVAYLVMHLSANADRGIISHVYVEPEARELGLGDSMVEHAVAAVIAAGLRGIEGSALPGDRETKNLFERAGITARKITLYRTVGAPPAEAVG